MKIRTLLIAGGMLLTLLFSPIISLAEELPPRQQLIPNQPIELSELLFNPHNVPYGDQDCDQDGQLGEDGNNQDNAADEFIELYNRSPLTITLDGLCFANRELITNTLPPGSNHQWAIPTNTQLPPYGFYTVCGRTNSSGNGNGFSIPDSFGNQIPGFANSASDWISLYEPVTPLECHSGIKSVIFSLNYPDGEANGQSWQACEQTLNFFDPVSEYPPSLNQPNHCPSPSTLHLSTIQAKNQLTLPPWFALWIFLFLLTTLIWHYRE